MNTQKFKSYKPSPMNTKKFYEYNEIKDNTERIKQAALTQRIVTKEDKQMLIDFYKQITKRSPTLGDGCVNCAGGQWKGVLDLIERWYKNPQNIPTPILRNVQSGIAPNVSPEFIEALKSAPKVVEVIDQVVLDNSEAPQAIQKAIEALEKFGEVHFQDVAVGAMPHLEIEKKPGELGGSGHVSKIRKTRRTNKDGKVIE